MFPFRGERYSYQFREHPKPSETEPDRARQKKNDTIKKNANCMRIDFVRTAQSQFGWLN